MQCRTVDVNVGRMYCLYLQRQAVHSSETAVSFCFYQTIIRHIPERPRRRYSSSRLFKVAVLRSDKFLLSSAYFRVPRNSMPCFATSPLWELWERNWPNHLGHRRGNRGNYKSYLVYADLPIDGSSAVQTGADWFCSTNYRHYRRIITFIHGYFGSS